MKNLKRILLLSIATVFLGGCIVTSVYPFYTPKDLISDPAIAGRWESEKSTNEFIKFEEIEKGTYSMLMIDSENTNQVNAHLFEIKGHRFLDAQMTNQTWGLLPEHYICKITKPTETLQLAWVSLDWLEKLLEKNPKTIQHMIIRDDSYSSQNGRIVLTADTKELQKFLLKYANNTNAFYPISYQKAAH